MLLDDDLDTCRMEVVERAIRNDLVHVVNADDNDMPS